MKHIPFCSTKFSAYIRCNHAGVIHTDKLFIFFSFPAFATTDKRSR